MNKMKYIFSILTLFSVTLAMSPQASEPAPPFTVNLLTKVQDMSIISPGGTIPISYTNATKHEIYETNVTWNVIGSATFQEERVPQWYLIDNNQWSANVSLTSPKHAVQTSADQEISIELRKRGELSHVDIAVSKEEPHGAGMRFDYLTPDFDGVDVSNVPTEITPKP
jgi:hypothetical protein